MNDLLLLGTGWLNWPPRYTQAPFHFTGMDDYVQLLCSSCNGMGVTEDDKGNIYFCCSCSGRGFVFVHMSQFQILSEGGTVL